MRLILAMPLMAAAVVGLGACGQSDDAYKASYRNELVAQCTRDAGRAAPAGANVAGLCQCMIDRYVANTPVDRLKAERNQSEMPPAAREAMMHCAQQEMQRQLGNVTTAIPPAPTVPAPEAPAPAAAEGEAAEGNDTGGQ
jgi:hypothetical protein